MQDARLKLRSFSLAPGFTLATSPFIPAIGLGFEGGWNPNVTGFTGRKQVLDHHCQLVALYDAAVLDDTHKHDFAAIVTHVSPDGLLELLAKTNESLAAKDLSPQWSVANEEGVSAKSTSTNTVV